MTTELEGAEPTVEETTLTPPPEAGFSSEENDTPPERNWEDEARKIGWVPESEWKGDKPPKGFLSAQEYVERGETVIPILNSRLAKQEKEFQERLERMERMSQKTLERERQNHQKELERIRQEKRAAVQAGDVDRFDALEEQEATLAKSSPDNAAEDGDAVEEEWVKRNDWYQSDPELAAFAYGISHQLASADPKMTKADNLKQTEARVKAAFPHKFSKSKTDANAHAPVDGGGTSPAPPQKKTLADRLPAEARRQAEKDVKAGAYKTVDAWAKVYFAS